jgi:hypothetical protein
MCVDRQKTSHVDGQEQYQMFEHTHRPVDNYFTVYMLFLENVIVINHNVRINVL